MNYELAFKESARKEWRKLDESVRNQFKQKLAERLEQPRIEADCLRNRPDYYKIKLRNAGYRLVYQVGDQQVLVTVIAVGRRDRLSVYRAAQERV